MAHFNQGALDKDSKKFIEPKFAEKRKDYSCPDCKRDVFVKKGEIKIPHFAHKSDPENRCTYNRNPSIKQQHRNAQLKLKEILNNGLKINIRRRCLCGICGYINGTIVNSHLGEGKIEYRFIFNNSPKYADVALIDGDSILCIFEVVDTHYTREEDRPDPWFEIHANEINNIESDSKEIVLTCLRQIRSPECIKDEEERIRKKQLEEQQLKEEVERSNKEWRERMEQKYKEQQKRYEESLKKRQEWQEEFELRKKEWKENHGIWDKEYEEQKDNQRKEAIQRSIQIENELKENREARIRFEEDRKHFEEEKKKTEELKKKRDFQLLQLSRQIPKCTKCNPFITLDYKDWNWRCTTCKDSIKTLHIKYDRD